MKRFVLIGAAGYIAERHMKAIKETGNTLVCASDKFDVMGRIDSYFPEAEFFLNTDKMFQFISDLREKGKSIDYVSICSPNYLHAKHICSALKSGANVICEKPLVIYPIEIEEIKKCEKKTGKKVYSVLQLRHHPTILKLKNEIDSAPFKIYDINLKYITSRGKWYFKSWKGDVQKSGGIATNIGIHFFDMLTWIFGKVIKNEVQIYEPNKAAGFLQLEKAKVRWFLSLDSNDLPETVKQNGKRTFRSIRINDKEIEFSDGFTNLHTTTYQNIFNGNGFGIADAKGSIILTDAIRNLSL